MTGGTEDDIPTSKVVAASPTSSALPTARSRGDDIANVSTGAVGKHDLASTESEETAMQGRETRPETEDYYNRSTAAAPASINDVPLKHEHGASNDGDDDKDSICYDPHQRDENSQDDGAENDSERHESENQIPTENNTQAAAVSTSTVESIVEGVGKNDATGGTKVSDDNNEASKGKVRQQEPEKGTTKKITTAEVTPPQEGSTDLLSVGSMESSSPNLEPLVRRAHEKGSGASGNPFAVDQGTTAQEKGSGASGNPFAVDQGTTVIMASLSFVPCSHT